jgi:thioredoxin reductase (NADPH)
MIVTYGPGSFMGELRHPIQHLFLFIGAEPNTDWLSGSGVALDRKGFVLTGTELAMPSRAASQST